MLSKKEKIDLIVSDPNLSLKAKGLISLVVSMDVKKDCLKTLLGSSKDGINSHAAALSELVSCGYLEKKESRNSSGHFVGFDYRVSITGSFKPKSKARRVERTSNKECIYLIESDGCYKIGKTKDVKKRSKTIKLLLPKKSKLLTYAFVENYHEVEKAMHEKFDHLRLNGEWFDLGENAETLFTDAINELK